MRRQYLSAPLPFQGQKRMFAKEFIKVLKHYPDDAVFVDLFGGSGLLSHITKCQKPDATVVYNDFDNYRHRLENIPRTNALLDKIREVVASVPRQKVLPEKTKEAILFLIEQEEKERGYVDYITLSTSHRGRHLYNELGAFRLFRRVADTRRHELYLFYLQQVIHHRVMRLDGQEQYHRKPVYRLRESGV